MRIQRLKYRNELIPWELINDASRVDTRSQKWAQFEKEYIPSDWTYDTKI